MTEFEALGFVMGMTPSLLMSPFPNPILNVLSTTTIHG
jgi:hypothetical protein